LQLLHIRGVSKVITAHFEKVIDRFIASGRFNNKSEVIRAGLRLLEEHELQVERATSADLERILDEDLADTRPAVPAEQLLVRRRH
jgi:antitoxin ParD1/3/4